jgi:hypothetical protein
MDPSGSSGTVRGACQYIYKRKIRFENAAYRIGDVPARELNSGGCEFLNEFFGSTNR